MPSPREKARILIEYGRRQGIATLVETGTYLGDTVAACLPRFEHVYTIELDEALYDAARSRFNGHPNVTVIQGDSYTELNRLAFEIMEPALFWLDAHYCAGPTAKGPHDPPLEWELRAIVLRGKGDVILIDDARHMGLLAGSFRQWIRRTLLRCVPPGPGYPSLQEIRQIVDERVSSFEVRRDIIRITLA